MATLKHRINISTASDVERALKRAALRDRVPVATKAAELIAIALEIEEDIALASLAALRMSKKARFISHDKAWN